MSTLFRGGQNSKRIIIGDDKKRRNRRNEGNDEKNTKPKELKLKVRGGGRREE